MIIIDPSFTYEYYDEILQIIAPKGSYAEEYAEENGIPFEAID